MMKARFRKYRPEDFLRVRDMFVNTGQISEKPINLDFVWWTYTRYFVAPYLGTGVMQIPSPEDSEKAIRFWESVVGIWENDDGIVGVVSPADHPRLGEAAVQRHPRYDFLLGEMLSYAEETLTDPRTKSLRIFHVYAHDEPFLRLVQQRGYQKGEYTEWDTEFDVKKLPEPRLPAGYSLRSMAHPESDLGMRCKVFGMAFNHPDPEDWPTVFSYEELQRAPDYRKDLDLYIVGPGGEYAACCIVWYDGHNPMGRLEPVGTHPAFRGMGLGREVVMEGIRRAAALGALKVAGGDGRFYEAIGFQKTYASHTWTKGF